MQTVYKKYHTYKYYNIYISVGLKSDWIEFIWQLVGKNVRPVK